VQNVFSYSGLLAQNITNLCETTINEYLDNVQSPSETRKSLNATILLSRKVYLGQHKLKSPQEWHTLLKKKGKDTNQEIKLGDRRYTIFVLGDVEEVTANM